MAKPIFDDEVLLRLLRSIRAYLKMSIEDFAPILKVQPLAAQKLFAGKTPLTEEKWTLIEAFLDKQDIQIVKVHDTRAVLALPTEPKSLKQVKTELALGDD